MDSCFFYSFIKHTHTHSHTRTHVRAHAHTHTHTHTHTPGLHVHAHMLRHRQKNCTLIFFHFSGLNNVIYFPLSYSILLYSFFRLVLFLPSCAPTKVIAVWQHTQLQYQIRPRDSICCRVSKHPGMNKTPCGQEVSKFLLI